mmetsp:Transcript_17331/g.54805  ORF Transcript_17331/g.54805 Transcript_17331/m.54805 type:complete len:225 (-) Transcript_17331:1239-1913(-)
MQKRNGCAHDDAPLVAERPPDDQPDQRDSKKIGQHLADGGQLHAVRQVVADARVILLQQFRRGVRPAGFHRLVAKALLGRGVTGRSERVKEGGRYAMVVHPCRWQPRLPEFVKYRAVGQHRGSSAREGFEDGEAIPAGAGAGRVGARGAWDSEDESSTKGVPMPDYSVVTGGFHSVRRRARRAGVARQRSCMPCLFSRLRRRAAVESSSHVSDVEQVTKTSAAR